MPRQAPNPVQVRLLDTLKDRIEQILITTSLVSRITKGTVTAVAAGQVTVSWRGADLTLPYLSSYISPTAGDVVALAKTGSQLLVLGRIVGTT